MIKKISLCLAVVICLLCFIALLQIKAEAASVGDRLPDGVVVSADANYCGCCHEHNHGQGLERIGCLFCRLITYYKTAFGITEPQAEHKYRFISGVFPTCVRGGSESYRCIICSKIESVRIESFSHNFITVPAVSPTCTENGLTEGEMCARCGWRIVKQQVIEAVGHQYDAGVVALEPACGLQGRKVYTCAACGTTKEESLAALEHVWEETILTQPTCTEAGEKAQRCTLCETIINREEIPALGHIIPADAKMNGYAYNDAENAGVLFVEYACPRCSDPTTGEPLFSEHYTEYKAVIKNENGINLYKTLEEALAAGISGDTVLVAADTVLENSAVVPADVTLIIPCNDEMTWHEENQYNPDCTSIYGTEYLYRTLTIAENATLTVNGLVILNAVTGRPIASSVETYGNTGAYGQIDLYGDIVVNAGGIFDCAGYIRNNGGLVTLKNGSVFSETYGVSKFRGGTYTTKHTEFFPIYESKMNNVQSVLRIESGAALWGTVKMYASNTMFYCRFPQVDNENGLVRLGENAYVVREIDTSNQCDIYSFYGDTTFSNSRLSITGLSIGTDIADFYLFDGDMKFNFYAGNHRIIRSFAFLPGFEINMYDGANVTFSARCGFAMFDRGFYEHDSLIWSPERQYTKGRANSVLHLYSGSTLNATGDKAELAGDVIVEDGAVLNFSDTAKQSLSFKVPVGVNTASDYGDYVLDLNLIEAE